MTRTGWRVPSQSNAPAPSLQPDQAGEGAVYVPDDAGDTWVSARWAADTQLDKALSVTLRSDLTWQFSATQVGDDAGFELSLEPSTATFGEPGGDRWHEFVANFVLSSDEEQGFFRLWHRVAGEEWSQVLDAVGRTANSTALFPFEVRMGMHSGHGWNAPQDRRILYYDEIRIGTAEAGFDTVAPGSAALPEP